MENDVFVLLLGSGKGAYALASAFAGDYGIPTALMDEEIPDAMRHSGLFTDVRTVSGIGYRGLLMRALSDFYENHAGKSLLLIPTTEEYTARVLEERDTLERMFLLPQKKCRKTEDLHFSAKGILLLYVGREGGVYTVYGEIVAATAEGKPLAVVTKPTPKDIALKLPTDVPHFALYLVGEEGEVSVAPDEYLDFLAFPSAADLSLAEWILTDYIPCETLPEDGDTPEGLFSIFPYRWIKRYVFPEKAETVKALHRRRLSVTLYSSRRLCLRRFYRENWQKITK